jgi:hypothetical protein
MWPSYSIAETIINHILPPPPGGGPWGGVGEDDDGGCGDEEPCGLSGIPSLYVGGGGGGERAEGIKMTMMTITKKK